MLIPEVNYEISADMSDRPGWNPAQAKHARKLIEKLLVVDINRYERMGISDLLGHKWFASCDYGLTKRPNVLELITATDNKRRQQ